MSRVDDYWYDMFMQILKKLSLSQIFLIGCAFLLLLLLFKDPFSQRNLISNLEPYPDTIHYLSPAINFIQGKGFYIEREGRLKNPNVPLMYSVSLMPLFLINQDVRVFYFTNILIAFLSLLILYKISKKLFKAPFILGLVLFLYVTNYFIYWFPTLAMAENLLIPIFLLSLLMLLEKVTRKRAILSGFLVLSFYATKYATIPLSASLFILYLLKIFWDKDKDQRRIKLLIYFILSASFAFAVFFLFEYLTKGVNIMNVVLSFLPLKSTAADISIAKGAAPPEPWFAMKFFYKNFPIYWNSITGHPMRFLWDFTPIVPRFVALSGLLGMTIGLFIKPFRFISLCLLTFLFSQILFISTFYSSDGRYIYHAVPLLIISFGLFLTILKYFLSKKDIKYSSVAFYCFLIILSLFFLYVSFARIKYQIALNLRHAETPWYYVSVEVANSYFDTLPKQIPNNKVFISALPPYYVEYFSKNRYKLLPLSKAQEFLREKNLVWGIDDDTDLIKLYSEYIKAGFIVFVSNYGLGNEAHLHRDYDNIAKNFKLIKVKEGCFNACNIYKLELENPNK